MASSYFSPDAKAQDSGIAQSSSDEGSWHDPDKPDTQDTATKKQPRIGKREIANLKLSDSDSSSVPTDDSQPDRPTTRDRKVAIRQKRVRNDETPQAIQAEKKAGSNRFSALSSEDSSDDEAEQQKNDAEEKSEITDDTSDFHEVDLN